MPLHRDPGTPVKNIWLGKFIISTYITYRGSMLHILFVPGTFGSTIQYILRAFSTTYTTDRLPNISYADMITADGSMHSFYKTGHYLKRTDLENLTEGSIPNITTPIYPMLDYHADEVINFFKDNFPTDKYIFIYINSIEYAEINMLAQYYKISNGVPNLSIGMFCGDNAHNIVNWNSNYKHWSEMQTWELRMVKYLLSKLGSRMDRCQTVCRPVVVVCEL